MGSRADDPSMHDSPTTIELYRSRHTIRRVDGVRPGIGRVSVCAVDGLRIHPVRPMGSWRHDAEEVRRAAGVPDLAPV